jgi:hypothetical protein
LISQSRGLGDVYKRQPIRIATVRGLGYCLEKIPG